MELYVAGGCSEHGRNSFLVTSKKVTFLVDAGKMKEIPDKPFPELSRKQIAKIDYLFLTHCHTDHTGALLLLYEKGFQGRVVASRATLQNIPGEIENAIVLEDLCPAGEETELCTDFRVTWGRSGHCIGSVWYRFGIGKKTILFTGDYEEHSYAYKCDKIRNLSADLAVLDCAYGTEKEDALVHRKELEELLDRLVQEEKPMLFPVPSHGRGFDVMKLLAERGVTCVLAESLVREYQDSDNREFWLKKSFLEVMAEMNTEDIRDFEAAFRKTLGRGNSFPRKYIRCGILVRDSQLVKEQNREVARGVAARGGRTVLTGKQDPASFARKILDEGKADFRRISVHQNISEMKKLIRKNDFQCVVPYHCREQLSFSEKNIKVLRTGDRIHF